MSIYIYFSAGTYGSKGIHQFQSAVAELGICIAADEVIESGADDQALDVTVNKLITNKAARVIVCFCDGNDVQLLIKALKRRGQEDYFTIIGRWVRFGSPVDWMSVDISLHFLFKVTLFVSFLTSGVGLPSHCFLNCIRFIYYSASHEENIFRWTDILGKEHSDFLHCYHHALRKIFCKQIIQRWIFTCFLLAIKMIGHVIMT